MSKLSTTWLRPFIVLALAAVTGTAAHAARFITEIVAAPPPEPLTETITVAPHPGWIWHPGYYRWEGNNYVWTGGEWVEPKPGYRWEPHVWVKEGKGWRLREGEWVKIKM